MIQIWWQHWVRDGLLRRRQGFSLVELMIATVILGFGLLMIGAVLPIAWKSSLDTSAQTRANAVASLAKFTVQSKCLVDSHRNLFNPLYEPWQPPDSQSDLDDNASYSLLGDWDTVDLIDDDGDGMPDLDTAGLPIVRPRVHALHLQNWGAANDQPVSEAPLLLGAYPTTLTDSRAVGIPVGTPVVGLRERVFPPLPDTLTVADSQWGELLRSRTFAWSVLHQLTRVPRTPADVRSFLFYYVTLRRGPTSRFARQDPDSLEPRALDFDKDVLFPIAWRVPLLVVESQSVGVGVPSIAFAGVESQDLSGLVAITPPLTAGQTDLSPLNNDLCKVADMLPRGAMFIDDRSGIVYRVTEREYLTDQLARLTLDKEVRPLDIVVNPATELAGLDLNSAGAGRRNRMVWVFPPAVEAGERMANNGGVRFVGPSPVIEIRVEPLTLRP